MLFFLPGKLLSPPHVSNVTSSERPPLIALYFHVTQDLHQYTYHICLSSFRDLLDSYRPGTVGGTLVCLGTAGLISGQG